MSTNVFGSSAGMAAVSAAAAAAASALGNSGASNGVSRHSTLLGAGGSGNIGGNSTTAASAMLHHHHHSPFNHHQHSTPVAPEAAEMMAAQLASALAANSNGNSATSPTAFPFPPPSPLFLPTPSLGSLQQSPTAAAAAAAAAAQHLQHLHQSLSTWMSHSPVSPHPNHHHHHLYNMALGKAAAAAAFSLKENQQQQQQLFHGSDDNNNDVVTTAVVTKSLELAAAEVASNHRSAFVSTKPKSEGHRQSCNGETPVSHQPHSRTEEKVAVPGEIDSGRKSSSSSSSSSASASSTSPFSLTSKSQPPPPLSNGVKSDHCGSPSVHQQQHWSTTSEQQQQQLSSSNTKESASSAAAYKPPTFVPNMTPYVNGTNSNHHHHHQHPNPLSGNSVNLGIRPPPPSPQTPTQAAAAAAAAVAGHGFNHSPHYSPYSMFPPSLYSYYSSQQQQQQQPSQAFSPTTMAANTNTNQQQQQQLSSPSPISPFLVPNLPLSSSSQASPPGLVVSSSMISNGGLLSNSSSFSFHESGSVHEQQKTSSRRGSRSSPLMDLTVDRTKMGGRSGGGQESPVDCSKQQQNCDLSAKASEGASTLESAILSGGVKRKGPSEEQHSTPSRQSLSATSESSERTSAMNDHQSSGGSASRKHRLSKPPNINISDCGSSSAGNPYRNGFPPPTSPFPLHSPLFAHSPHPFGGTGGSGHLVPTSPFAAHPAYHHPHHFPHHLEHSIPLSAPPMAAFSSHHHSHHQSSSSTPKFDFSVGAMTGQPSSASAAAEFTFPASRGHFSNTAKENLPSSSGNTTSTANTSSSSSSSAKLISSSQKEATIIPSSIMKDTSKSSNRKSSLGGGGGGSSECKVTFQVPHQSRGGGSSSAITGESKSERGKGGESASNRKTAINNNRKSAPAISQKHYPEYFRKGSTIRLGNGALKKVEELSSADFIDSVSASAMSSSSSAFGASGKFKVEQSEVLAIGERSNRRSPGTGNNLVRITFLVGSPAVAVSLESPLEHPFFVVAKGWSSCSPSSTLKRYGLQCQRLAKGDSVVTLASRTAPVSGGTPSKGENRGTSLLNSSPRSLASSSGSLSSSSSSSASSSSSTSTTASPLLNCPPPPPPAHHLGSLLSSSFSSAAATAARLHSNQHNLESSGVLNLDTKSGRHKLSRSNSQQQEEDEEIDVENVDEQQQS